MVDSKGKIVGPYSFVPVNGEEPVFASVLLNINGVFVELPVITTGFIPADTSLFYSGQNCTGTAYMPVVPDQLVLNGVGATSEVGISNGILYYPTPGPSSTAVTVCSQLDVSSGTCSALRFGCGEIGLPLSAESTFDLSTLGFVPPFQLQSKP